MVQPSSLKLRLKTGSYQIYEHLVQPNPGLAETIWCEVSTYEFHG